MIGTAIVVGCYIIAFAINPQIVNKLPPLLVGFLVFLFAISDVMKSIQKNEYHN